jgi:hypothetical protein
LFSLEISLPLFLSTKLGSSRKGRLFRLVHGSLCSYRTELMDAEGLSATKSRVDLMCGIPWGALIRQQGLRLAAGAAEAAILQQK